MILKTSACNMMLMLFNGLTWDGMGWDCWCCSIFYEDHKCDNLRLFSDFSFHLTCYSCLSLNVTIYRFSSSEQMSDCNEFINMQFCFYMDGSLSHMQRHAHSSNSLTFILWSGSLFIGGFHTFGAYTAVCSPF